MKVQQRTNKHTQKTILADKMLATSTATRLFVKRAIVQGARTASRSFATQSSIFTPRSVQVRNVNPCQRLNGRLFSFHNQTTKRKNYFDSTFSFYSLLDESNQNTLSESLRALLLHHPLPAKLAILIMCLRMSKVPTLA
jgi:hypothetical protein